MNRCKHLKDGMKVLGLLWAVSAGGQVIRLPGGITIGRDPRQGGRTNIPGVHPGHPDPNSVCPKTIEWLNTLQKEYPTVDLPHSTRVQQMAVPLFADESFQKAFGISYPKLSDAERRDFQRMHIIPCTNSRQFGPIVTVLQVFNTPFMPGTVGMGPLSPGQLIPALTRLSTARAELRAHEQTLTGTAPSVETYDRAISLAAQRKADLAIVWPSEKAQFEGTVKDAVEHSSGVAIQAKLQPLLSAPASPEAIEELKQAPGAYADLFRAMPADQRTVWISKLDERRGAMLRELLPPQRARADAFPATRQGLDDGAEWYASYRRVFLDPPALPEASTLAQSYVARREAALAKLAPQFKQKIEASQDASAVASMYDEVFRLPEDRETAAYRQISAARTSRADLLNQRAEQARLAAQEKAERAAVQRGEIVASNLKVASLANAAAFRALYVGDFAHAGLQRSSLVFVDAFDDYLQTFGASCKDSLPADKVEMSEPECKQPMVRTVTRGFAVVSQTEYCAEWGRRPLGVYADPKAFAAKVQLEGAAQSNGFRDFLSVLKTPDPLSSASGQMGNLVANTLSLRRDIPQLIQENGCGSKALARLQENLTRFASGDDPIHIAGSQAGTTKVPRADDLDVSGLAADLIRANAAGWIFNQFQGLAGAEVVGQLDPQGRPRHIQATYSQRGIVSTGSVDIAFVDGVPSCLYFSDEPTNCKPASPSIVKRYEDGDYRRKSSR